MVAVWARSDPLYAPCRPNSRTGTERIGVTRWTPGELMRLQSCVKGNKIMCKILSVVIFTHGTHYASVITCITMPHVAIVWTELTIKRFVFV